MPGVEAAGGVGQDQLHFGIGLAVAADGCLIDRVGEGAIAHHVQRDCQPERVGCGDMFLGKIGLNGRGPGRVGGGVGTGAGFGRSQARIQRGHGVVAFQAGHAQAADFVEDGLGVHVGGDDHLAA